MNLRETVGLAVVQLHRGIYNLSGGRLLSNVMGMTVLELTTTGAKSGKPRTAMLTAPIRHDGNLVIVASRGGDVRHPAWYHNLKANPQVKVKVKGSEQTMTARVLPREERDRLWPEVTKSYKGYAGYAEKTDRVIPLVVLEP